MKFTCTRDNLMHALDLVGSVAGKQTNLPILENILVSVTEGKVECAATNLELAIRTPIRAKIETEGSFTIPGKTLADYIRLVSDDHVTLSTEGNELTVETGSASTKIKGSPADEYPVLPDADAEAHAYTLLADPLRDAISKTALAAAKNEIRPELSGIYVGFFTERYAGLIMAATDSYRLAEKKLSVSQGSDELQAIIPAKTAIEMMKLLGSASPEGESQVRLSLSSNQLVMRYGQAELTSKLIDGQYPNYAQIIPETFQTTALVDAGNLIKKIKAASLFTTLGINAVSFDFNVEGSTLGVSSTSTQKGEHSSHLDADLTGEENSILLNHKYVLDGLNHLDSGICEFSMNGPDAPCLFRIKGSEDYLYIVMPIRQ